MFGATTRILPRWEELEKAEQKATFRNLHHAAFSLRKIAVGSIEKSDEPAAEGDAPHTRGKSKKNLRGAIFTDVGVESAIIGPRASWVGDVGEALEFGKQRKKTKSSEHPFMGPALDESRDRFAADYEGSIGE